MEDLQGGTFSRRNPKGDSEQKIGCAEEIPCSDHIEMSCFCIRPAGELWKRTRKPPFGS